MKTKKEFFTFDVETWGLDATPESFALGVIYGENFVYKTTDLARFRYMLLSKKFRNKTLFAHNAIYDLSTIFGNILTNLDSKAVFNNSTFICARNNYVTFADSLNIFPTSLKKLGELFGDNKGETPEKFKTGKRGPITDEDIEYCVKDCKILFDALNSLFTEIGCIRLTLASLSMAYFRRLHLPQDIFYNDLVYEFFDSYYGGRVECFRLGKVTAQKFDINSMYPYAMKVAKFPDPGNLRRDDNPPLDKFRFLLEYYEGMVKAKVIHRDGFIGYLPVKHNGKLIFPTGTFTGTWNFNELRYAVKSKVVKVISVEYCIYSKPIPSIFESFVTDVYNKRNNATNEFQRYLYKIILNSLYGKFAQKRKHNTRYVENMQGITLKDNEKVTPFNSDRLDAFVTSEEQKWSYNTIPSFSSYITSFARVQLLDQIIKYAENDIVYIDTDSIAVNNYTMDIETGPKLGQFKLENKIIKYIYGNKSYKEKDGTLVMKGVRKGAKMLKGNKFSYLQMVKPRTALRRNIKAGSFIKVTKTISDKYDKRLVFTDGSTWPIHLTEKTQNK